MRVYLVIWGVPYESNDILGIYSNMPAAEECLAYHRAHTDPGGWEYLSIEEEDVEDTFDRTLYEGPRG